ncbi:SDR family NAD(P)-dependent oxidoreductase [Novosphingobium sp. PY1]|uniref:SDR family NAD(P)-dependent oxidoreductase n=1 Tax=Novosphingobium sp. PY1 TaxID=1882221 RepID=UPI001A8F2948|nr:SDR family NAD(P)-dependent oxidoreductase [Novosphingobium sp. PY1]GFM31049.1 SDR-family protein [Novosphingobium sp. PY1]
MNEFEGRTAVITGAGSGIGAALAKQAAGLGMRLVLADINAADLAGVASGLSVTQCLTRVVDVTDPEAVDALAHDAFAQCGDVALVCNNAGVVPGGRHRMVWEFTPEDWRWAFGVNVDGVTNGIRSFVPRLIAQDKPAHVLNTASVAGFVSGSGSAVYGASKHAVVRITEALFAGLREVGAPIGVTMLCPGLVATRIYDAERSRPEHLRARGGRPEEAPELQAIADDLYRSAPSPEAVAELAFEGIRANQFYVFTTERFDAGIRARAQSIVERANPTFESILELSKDDVGVRDAGVGVEAS